VKEKNLIEWVRYNHNVLNGIELSNSSVSNFIRVKRELAAASIHHIAIRGIDKDGYTT